MNHRTGLTSTLMPTLVPASPGRKWTGSSPFCFGQPTSSRHWATWRLRGACCGLGWQISHLRGPGCTRPNTWSGPKVEKFVNHREGGGDCCVLGKREKNLEFLTFFPKEGTGGGGHIYIVCMPEREEDKEGRYL